MSRSIVWPATIAAAAVVAGCAGGGSSGSDTTSAPASTSTSVAAASPLVEEATRSYQQYAVEQTGQLVGAVAAMTDAVRAGDLAAAQAAYAPSRLPWERIEPLAGLIEDIDGRVDSRVDDFGGPDDPAFTGWHRLEYLLFARNTTDGGAPFADQLDRDIAELNQQMPTVQIAPIDVPNGAAELIEEVSQGKITGEEDRYSKTDLWDFDANLQGSQAAVERLEPALAQADPELLAGIDRGFADIYATLAPLRRGDGWVLFCTANDPFPSPRCPEVTVPPQTIDTLKAQLASLSEDLSQMSGALGLQ